MKSLVLLLTFVFASAAQSNPDIAAVLTAQVQAWNAGNVEGFVTSYGENAVFVGSDSTRGRHELLERYRRRYPNRAAMGALQFSQLEIHKLDEKFATVTGKWRVTRTKDAGGDVGGVFSLVM